MERIEPRTLSGFMELLPNEQILFNQMKEKIQKSYEKLNQQKYYLQKQVEKQKNKYIDFKKEIVI